MTFQVSFLPKHLVRVGAVIIFAIGASACSSVPNWVDPTNWIGGSDDQPAPDQTEQAPDGGQTPDLSTIPDKPNAPSTADEQQKVSQSLASDRARAQYSADALKGGTEPAAAPPAAEAAQHRRVGLNDNAPTAWYPRRRRIGFPLPAHCRPTRRLRLKRLVPEHKRQPHKRKLRP